MILVADSSALIALSMCNVLKYLEVLFGQVKVPPAVYNEIKVEGKKESAKLSKYLEDKIEYVNLEEYIITDMSIAKGELEAMALYKRLKADKLLVDDKRARKLAKFNDINTIGSLGVLLAAKQKGLIEHIRPYVEIIEQSDIYIKKDLIRYVLKLAGESG